MNTEIDESPMSIEEVVRFNVENLPFALHGKQESIVKILEQFSFVFTLEMNEWEPQDLIGHDRFNDSNSENQMIPPIWYNDFCAYCQEHSNHDCVLLIKGITKCEPSKQVVFNSLFDERKLQMGGSDFSPLPTNSSVIVLVEDKEESSHEYFNLTTQVFRRLSHVYLNKTSAESSK